MSEVFEEGAGFAECVKAVKSGHGGQVHLGAPPVQELEQEVQLDRGWRPSLLVWEPSVWAELCLIWTFYCPSSSP